MKLHYRQFGEGHAGTPLLLLHGLLGSLVNWQRIARALEERHRVIVPDLRNHGRSPHDPDVSYPAMAGDLLELMDDLGEEQVIPVGHSMGGKTAMWLALEHPRRVERLVVVDIAPVTYAGGRLEPLLDALLALPLGRIQRRADADALLKAAIPDGAVRAYLLQNLVHTEAGWRWRTNLRALRDGLDLIGGFPPVPPGGHYPGATLFIHGRRSDYLRPEHRPVMERLFPRLELAPLDAGHWVYAERPEAFMERLERFLLSRS